MKLSIKRPELFTYISFCNVTWPLDATDNTEQSVRSVGMRRLPIKPTDELQSTALFTEKMIKKTHQINQSINRFTDESMNGSINQSSIINQSIDLPMNQWMDQSINQSMNPWFMFVFHYEWVFTYPLLGRGWEQSEPRRAAWMRHRAFLTLQCKPKNEQFFYWIIKFN